MPHKKAKRSLREEQRKEKGFDLAPGGKDSISNEAIPKSASRVLDAFKIREEYQKKRKLAREDGDESKAEKRRKTNEVQQKIKPGESIQHFYRRVEDDMRPLVRSAVQSSKAVERKARITELEEKKKKRETKANANKKQDRGHVDTSPPPPPSPVVMDKHANKPKEFQKVSTSAPRRLNDIALAPPEFKKVPRGAIANGLGGKRDGVLSMAQKSMMEAEREKVIERYRALKASRIATSQEARGS